ncbi:NADH dehydrogenase [ubiquinone] 1 alpha subcomplex assembly factor 2 [Culex quinquefasciatus]|uniref:NADH dehydrogenase [ubiquinone] 1 alpha subcomplex assembly factor 2 n=1 Tax=Culex quinquefasciatus TaxID=7176 RepID=UPI0018E34C8B|nr:NADH dehydrogenase [ubiquinone] 1 alpha subcomplex assembly factor 2 [Culex quinquefasciatus]
MAQPPTRSLMRILFQTFMNSLKPRQLKGNLVGEDYFGNKYYEIQANSALGQTRNQRWFEPTEKEAYNQEVTAEWEAWLRGRRKEPPTEQELLRNLAIMKLKEKNAAELEAKHAKPKDLTELEKNPTGMGSFPQYEDYEVMPGKGKREK